MDGPKRDESHCKELLLRPDPQYLLASLANPSMSDNQRHPDASQLLETHRDGQIYNANFGKMQEQIKGQPSAAPTMAPIALIRASTFPAPFECSFPLIAIF